MQVRAELPPRLVWELEGEAERHGKSLQVFLGELVQVLAVRRPSSSAVDVEYRRLVQLGVSKRVARACAEGAVLKGWRAR